MVPGDGVVEAEDIRTTPQAARGARKAGPARVDGRPHEVLVVKPGALGATTIHPPIMPSLLASLPVCGMTTAQATSVGGLAEPAGEVVVQVLLIVADPGDVAVGA